MNTNPRITTPQGGGQVVKASGLYPGDRECNSHPPYQTLAFNAWNATLAHLRQFKKTRDYGQDTTPDSLWASLPKSSQQYWIDRSRSN